MKISFPDIHPYCHIPIQPHAVAHNALISNIKMKIQFCVDHACPVIKIVRSDHSKSRTNLLLALRLPSTYILPNPIQHFHEFWVQRASLKDVEILV
jgi:hypothetical protein